MTQKRHKRSWVYVHSRQRTVSHLIYIYIQEFHVRNISPRNGEHIRWLRQQFYHCQYVKKLVNACGPINKPSPVCIALHFTVCILYIGPWIDLEQMDVARCQEWAQRHWNMTGLMNIDSDRTWSLWSSYVLQDFTTKTSDEWMWGIDRWEQRRPTDWLSSPDME